MHFLSISDFTHEELLALIVQGNAIKNRPKEYCSMLAGKTLLMIFEKPSLRTHLSFEVGMAQMGGKAIFLDTTDMPLGSGKESIADTAKTASRYVDVMMARMYEHQNLLELSQHSQVPVINGLTNDEHPCQALGDMMTLLEKKEKLHGTKITYFGDANNNVTHSLLDACSLLGVHLTVCCPKHLTFLPNQQRMDRCLEFAKKSGAKIQISDSPTIAIQDADAVYTDTWMSYHISKEHENERFQQLQPFQVTNDLMKRAKPDAIFMHCLPAHRGEEQTAEVLDGAQSVVFDQVENRLHIQKSILLFLLKLL